MMKRIAWKFAASSLVLAAVTMTAPVQGVGASPASAASSDERMDARAAALLEQAGRAIASNKIAEAVGLLEQAVALAPRDAGYRQMLADAYMKSGRFQSAEESYREVLELDRGRSRAALAMALMQVANGRPQEAMTSLDQIEGAAPPADLGLAYALAGAPKRAIDVLEPAARSMGASPRVRQNLALAYAFGGDWQRARTIASQDVSPAELGERMTSWAALARQPGAPEPVAAMLGVSPVKDTGRPIEVALNPQPPAVIAAPQPIEYAEASVPTQTANASASAEEVPMPVDAAPAAPAAPVEQAPVRVTYAEVAPAEAVMPEEAVVAPAAKPVTFAEAAPAGEPVSVPAPAPTVESAPAEADYAELEAPEWGVDQSGSVELPEQAPVAEREPVRVQFAAAAETLVRPDPVVMRVPRRNVRSLRNVVSRGYAPLPGKRSATGQFVVQIGAFSSAQNADRAWHTYEKSYGLKAEQPVTMTFDHDGRLLHRVAISGFEKRGEATRVCEAIRSRGGECFVRTNAGDAAIDWAARYSRIQNG